MFSPNVWRGGAKIKWCGAAVALMRWRENFSQKNAAVVRWRKDLKAGGRRGGANFKKWRAPTLFLCDQTNSFLFQSEKDTSFLFASLLRLFTICFTIEKEKITKFAKLRRIYLHRNSNLN